MFGLNKKKDKEEPPEPPLPNVVVKAKTTKSLLKPQEESLQDKIMAEFQETYGSMNLDESQALNFGIYAELRLIRDLLATKEEK